MIGCFQYLPVSCAHSYPSAARRCCRGAVSKQVGRRRRRRVRWRATAIQASACVRLTHLEDRFDLRVRSAVIAGPGLPRRLVRVERVGVVAGPLGPAVFLVVGQAVRVLQGAALKDHRVRAGIYALVHAEPFGHGHGDGRGAVAATRRRDFPDRRVPRAVRDRGTVWILLRVAATSHIVGSGHGRVAACLALGLVRDAIAHRAIVGSGGGHESGEREEENARHVFLFYF